MEFRPCIDIHNGQVKQIVGGSLRDLGDYARENFVATQDAAFYAGLYRDAGLKGGHVILLNAKDSPYYQATKEQALLALSTYPQGLMVGGGIDPDCAGEFLSAGASHVIVTSYVFYEGRIDYERLRKMEKTVGREHLVLDVSCRKVEGVYRVVTDRWQRVTEERMDEALLTKLSSYCDEFLIHAVDVEGRQGGIEEEVARRLGAYAAGPDSRPVTYAGGVHSLTDLKRLKELGGRRVHVTIGSALSLFGGGISWEDVLQACE